MSQSLLCSAIQAAGIELQVDTANTPSMVEEAYRLRYQVYCLERGYEPGRDGLETDAYDAFAKHVVLRLTGSGTVIGTARLVLAQPKQLQSSFPMQEVCAKEHLAAFPLARMSEISRFSMRKERGDLSPAAASLSRLMLVRGLVMLSHQEGIQYWCAAMERTLLRLLRASSIHFAPLGDVVEYHGLRQPAFCHLPEMLARMRAEQPLIWNLVTDSGRVFDCADLEQQAA